MTQLEIDVYSDFVCPWCFIGWRRLQAALESFGHMDVVKEVRHVQHNARERTRRS